MYKYNNLGINYRKALRAYFVISASSVLGWYARGDGVVVRLKNGSDILVLADEAAQMRYVTWKEIEEGVADV